jgi:hypothetical protein
MHSAIVGFRSRLQESISMIRSVVVFLSPSKNMTVWCNKLGHDHFLPHPFLVIIYKFSEILNIIFQIYFYGF